jgi:hypothetical protein
MTGINTFMDCPYRSKAIEGGCYYPVIHGYHDGTKQDEPTWCEIYVTSKMCPEGFVI